MHHKYTSIPIQYTTSVLQGNFALLTKGWARDEIRVRRSGAWARERRLQQKPQRSSVLYTLDTALMNYSWITTCFVVFLYHLWVRGHQTLLRDSPLVMIWKFVSSMQSPSPLGSVSKTIFGKSRLFMISWKSHHTSSISSKYPLSNDTFCAQWNPHLQLRCCRVCSCWSSNHNSTVRSSNWKRSFSCLAHLKKSEKRESICWMVNNDYWLITIYGSSIAITNH